MRIPGQSHVSRNHIAGARPRGSVFWGLAALLATVALVATAGTPSASAATCYHNGCNKLDPYQTGCAQGAYEVTWVGRSLRNPWSATNGSVVHLFWSPTCQTNWAVVTQPQSCYDQQGTRVIANVRNNSTGQVVGFSISRQWAPTYVWGNMVYSPGPAQAYGEIDCNGPYDYSGWTAAA